MKTMKLAVTAAIIVAAAIGGIVILQVSQTDDPVGTLDETLGGAVSDIRDTLQGGSPDTIVPLEDGDLPFDLAVLTPEQATRLYGGTATVEEIHQELLSAGIIPQVGSGSGASPGTGGIEWGTPDTVVGGQIPTTNPDGTGISGPEEQPSASADFDGIEWGNPDTSVESGLPQLTIGSDGLDVLESFVVDGVLDFEGILDILGLPEGSPDILSPQSPLTPDDGGLGAFSPTEGSDGVADEEDEGEEPLDVEPPKTGDPWAMAPFGVLTIGILAGGLKVGFLLKERRDTYEKAS